MKSYFTVLLLLGALPATLRAQSSNGYVFFAPGGASCCGSTSMTVHFGGGGEAVLWKGIGAGAELGALAFRQDFNFGGGLNYWLDCRLGLRLEFRQRRSFP